MAKYREDLKFQLSKPIKYHNGNKEEETIELLLKAPSIKNHFRIGNVLQSMFTTSLIKAQKNMLDIAGKQENVNIEQKPEDEFEVNKTLIHFCILSLGKEINEFYDTFESLLLSKDICFLKEGIGFSEFELNILDYDDFKRLVNEYLASFFIVSWMKAL